MISDQPTIETTIYDYIEVNGRISKKLFEKVVIPKLEELTKTKAQLAVAVELLMELAKSSNYRTAYYGEDYCEFDTLEASREALAKINEIDKGEQYGERIIGDS